MVTTRHAAKVRPKGAAHHITRVIVIVVTAAWVLGQVLEGIMLIAGRLLLTFGEAEPILLLERLPTLIRVEPGVDFDASMMDADLSLRLLNALPLFTEAITVAMAAWLLLRVIRQVADGDTFSDTAIRRWRTLSVTLIGGGVLTGVLNTLAVGYLSWHLGFGPNAPNALNETVDILGAHYSVVEVDFPHWPVALIIAGLITLTLTTAFRTGAHLEREVDGLV